MTDVIAMGGIDRNTAKQQNAGGCQAFPNARFRSRLSTVAAVLTGRTNKLSSLANIQTGNVALTALLRLGLFCSAIMLVNFPTTRRFHFTL